MCGCVIDDILTHYIEHDHVFAIMLAAHLLIFITLLIFVVHTYIVTKRRQ